ncbi:DUF2283 domain-containing protein [Nanoarchaeota archaeon]
MKISYDKDADAMYIEFREGEFKRNQKIDDFTIIDFDVDDNMMGIELLEVSKRIPSESLAKLEVDNLVVV